MGESLRIKILANRLTTKTLFLRTGVSPIFKLACSRRSDSRAREKNSRREKNENKEQLETVRAQECSLGPVYRYLILFENGGIFLRLGPPSTRILCKLSPKTPLFKNG